MSKQQMVWSKCMGCGTIIPALDTECTSCAVRRLNTLQYSLATKRRAGQSLGNRR